MKKTHTVRAFAAGFLTALLLAAMIPSALALAGKTVTIYPGVSIYMDDQKLDPTDANGNPVEVFIYNGTTYLPVRAIGEALGQVVQWDGSTHSVYVGKHAGDKPAAWLSQMDYFTGTEDKAFYTAPTEKDNTGAAHTNCIIGWFNRTYLLNGQYSRMTGTLYQPYETRAYPVGDFVGDRGFYIYGDGDLLYSYFPEAGDVIRPLSFDVDLTGVLELKVVFHSAKGYDGFLNNHSVLSLGEVGLWT